jgi:hypothetical protein
VRSRVGRRLADQPLRNLGAVGAALVLLGTAAFGGLETAETPGLAPFAVDGTVVAAPFEITVSRVVWADDLPGQALTDEANRWIAVIGTVLSTHSESLGSELAEAVTLVDVEGLVAAPVAGIDAVRSSQQLLLADGTQLSPIQPGLEYEVVLLFEQSGLVPPPDEVTVQISGHTWRADSFDQTLHWLDPTPVAEATVPARTAVETSADGTSADGTSDDEGAGE